VISISLLGCSVKEPLFYQKEINPEYSLVLVGEEKTHVIYVG
jgi:hypothetical protein